MPIVEMKKALPPSLARVCDLLLEDLSDKEIAARLGLSARTVASYLDAARHKFNARSRVGLALRWNDYRKNTTLEK